MSGGNVFFCAVAYALGLAALPTQAALVAAPLASWDFNDGDLVADTLAPGMSAEIGVGVIGSGGGLPTLSFAMSPAVDGGPALQVSSSGGGRGATFTITNSSSEIAYVESVSLSFVGQGADSLTLFFTDEPLPTTTGWFEIDDGIPAISTPTSNFSFDLVNLGFTPSGKELEPGESLSVMLAANAFDPSSVFVDSLSFVGTAVPEPSQASLLLCGIGLVCLRRRRC